MLGAGTLLFGVGTCSPPSLGALARMQGQEQPQPRSLWKQRSRKALVLWLPWSWVARQGPWQLNRSGFKSAQQSLGVPSASLEVSLWLQALSNIYSFPAWDQGCVSFLPCPLCGEAQGWVWGGWGSARIWQERGGQWGRGSPPVAAEQGGWFSCSRSRLKNCCGCANPTENRPKELALFICCLGLLSQQNHSW